MDSDTELQAASFLSGLILGAALGASFAVLTAPRKGVKTRKRIKKVARRVRGDATDRLDDLANELKGRVDEAIDTARSRLPA